MVFLIRAIRKGTALQSPPQPAPVHFVGVPEASIPKAVVGFLGKSEKLVPTTHLPSFSKFAKAVEDFGSCIFRKSVAATFYGEHIDPQAILQREPLESSGGLGIPEGR